jgi:hypothetical protein
MEYKILKNGYPDFIAPNNSKIVDEAEFIQNDNRIPVFIGTQFGIYPKRFSDFNEFIDRKIAVIGKSLLSGVQTDLKEYLLDRKTIEYLQKQNTIEK